ncbi:LysR family transcriptional regulator [Marinobacter bohaiensis]|uniref:LysR family transcriptional regulator n=1 Tax=Marinobacter bohaiensis TaxID=2201898 RepID=UPI000DAD3E25|nr:LysR family transcriptional regulator [Marinobacter bohaiensis]
MPADDGQAAFKYPDDRMPPFLKAPNLRHLRMVQIVGKLGGVSRASRELHSSQPTVTQAVANHEIDVGVKLFDRCVTGTYPTTGGQQYLRRLDRFFDILDTAIEQIMAPSGSEPSLRILPVERLVTGTQLRALIAASHQSQLRATARSLGRSPTSLFRSARTLERTLNKPLFERTLQGPVLNRTGQCLALAFQRALREIELARGEIHITKTRGGLELIVGTLPMAGSHTLAEAARRFVTAYPAVTLRLVSGGYHKLITDLTQSRIDMIFGRLGKPDWAQQIQEEALFRDNYCLLARPDHPLAGKNQVTIAELAYFQWVVPPRGTPRRARIEAIFAGTGTSPRFHIEASSPTISRTLLLDSDTITLMPQSEVRQDIDLGTLVQLRCTNVDHVLSCHTPYKGVTTRSDWLPTEAHTAFVDSLRQVTAQFGLVRPLARARRRKNAGH